MIDNESPQDYGKIDAAELQKGFIIGKDLKKLNTLRKKEEEYEIVEPDDESSSEEFYANKFQNL